MVVVWELPTIRSYSAIPGTSRLLVTLMEMEWTPSDCIGSRPVWSIFRNTNTTGVADFEFIFGDPGDKLVAGDWDGDGEDTVAVYRPSNGMFYVRNSNTQGNADATFPVGIYNGVIALHP